MASLVTTFRSLLVPFCLTTSIAFGQAPLKCGTDAVRQRLIQQDPGMLQRESDLERFVHDYLEAHAGERSVDTVFVIPVVFHILHNNGPENISDEQVRDAVRILNDDYRKLNADTSVIVAGFDTIAGDAGIEFRLATRDNLGQCTNGIQRIRTLKTYQGDDGAKLKPWNHNNYLNIWTCSQMEDGVAGYAYYPSAVSGLQALADGVMILHDYVGSIGTSAPGRSRALTHEIGHYLNLQHTWGNNNDPGVACGDDGVEDTPITKGWTSCVLNAAVCDTAVIENVQNYMDYSYCSVMYTEGQTQRMRAALHSSTGGRSNLWTAENLALTGTDGITDQLCAPNPDMYVDHAYICSGETVSFTDNSNNGDVTFWAWTFADGNPATSTDQDPDVTFTTQGSKDVTLTVSNAQGTNTRTFFAAVHVAAYPEAVGLYDESFDGDANLWAMENPEGNATNWEYVGTVGHNNPGSALLDNYNSFFDINFLGDNNGDQDALVSPVVDLTYISAAKLTFWEAYATQTTNLNDATETLKIYSSINCGETWILRETLEVTDLLTGGATPFYYAPSIWNYHEVSLPSSLSVANARFKFVFTSSALTNNLYLDDINITGLVGVGEIGDVTDFLIAPNPVTNSFTVQYALKGAQQAELEILAADGRVVYSTALEASGQGTLVLDKSALGNVSGLYMVRLITAAGSTTRKLIVQ
ncbi:MAG: M43 family zinc metalloprotease [Flavobacteriales bacterium]